MPTPSVQRNRTTLRDLALLERTLETIDKHRRRAAVAARLEISRDGGEIVAQIISDKLRRPVAARGRDIPEALRRLVDSYGGNKA